LREHIIVKGHHVRSRHIDRGPLLVFDKEEWLSRYGTHITTNLTLVLILPIIILVTVFFLVPILILVMSLTMAVVVSMSLFEANRTLSDLRRGGQVPGVYDHGVELTIYPRYGSRLFIPWHEMENAYIKKSRIFTDMVLLVGHERRWLKRFPKYIMGDLGLKVVRNKIGDTRVCREGQLETGPPRLVLYGHSNVRSEATREEPATTRAR
jgi:hypothetical protein